MLLTLKLKRNVVYDITKIEQHELLGFDAGRPLSDMIPKWTNSLTVIEGGLSHFFQTTATARIIWYVCKARLVIQAENGQPIPCKPPGERELRVIQEARTWSPVPISANFLLRPAEPVLERIQSVAHYWTQEACEEPYGIRGRTASVPSFILSEPSRNKCNLSWIDLPFIA